ncbi:recombinase family protein [Citrobacter freundii]|nr:recombinase family protein [Citrobacter freundii]MCY3452548.1 recombinase family protein [Citrobacter freundii]
MSGERSSGSTYDLGNVSDSGSLSRYSKSTVRRHRRVSHFEVEFAVFEDTASGAKADRPGLADALAYLRDGDVLVVWRLDRLGRSLPHLIETVGKLEARGVGFRSLTENIDTTTPGGRLIFHVFGALGQFERDLIRERTKAGLTAAAARGRKGGRKPVVTADKLQRARELVANGLNVREAAARLKVGKTALYAALQAASSGSAADS